MKMELLHAHEHEVREVLVTRVCAALEHHAPMDTMCADGEELPHWKACSQGDCPVQGYARHAAELAVLELVEFLQNLPTRTLWPDGTETLSWPDRPPPLNPEVH